MNIKEYYNNKLKEIDYYLEAVDSRLIKEETIPDYKMRVTTGHGKYDYYYHDTNGNLIYIPVSEREKARKMIQKDYDLKTRNMLLCQKRLLISFIKKYEENPVEYVYEKCCKGRQVMIEPFVMPREEYIDKWFMAHLGEQNPFSEKGKYLTNRGEMVRSKSEKILADMFYNYGIPYQYEATFRLRNGRTVYPDFTLLNVRERKTYLWEHFGLASEKEYSDKNLEKIVQYECAGVFVGDNLIISAEASGMSLDIKLIEEKIKRYLL